MSTLNIKFNDKIRKSVNICFLELSEEFPRDSKTFRIRHDKRVTGVRVTGFSVLSND